MLPKVDKKTCKMGGLFVSSCLKTHFRIALNFLKGIGDDNIDLLKTGCSKIDVAPKINGDYKGLIEETN